MHTIILIGMPGSGKTTIGRTLASMWGRPFVDTDQRIAKRIRRSIPEAIATVGEDAFLDYEAQIIQRLCAYGVIISTGGSVVYNADTMRHLKSLGTIIYLKVGLRELKRRIAQDPERGIISRGLTLTQLWRERRPLYEHWADRTITCGKRSPEQIARQILKIKL